MSTIGKDFVAAYLLSFNYAPSLEYEYYRNPRMPVILIDTFIVEYAQKSGYSLIEPIIPNTYRDSQYKYSRAPK